MTRTNNRYRILNLFCCLVLAAFAPSLASGEECGSTTKGSPEGPPLQPEDVCSIQIPQIGPDSNPAVQNADEFAWRLFSEANQPADDGTNDTLWANVGEPSGCLRCQAQSPGSAELERDHGRSTAEKTLAFDSKVGRSRQGVCRREGVSESL